MTRGRGVYAGQSRVTPLERSVEEVADMMLRVEATKRAPQISRSKLNAIRDQIASRFDDVALVISELVTNSVRHADSPGEIAVRINVGASSIHIEVTDSGLGFDPSQPRDGMGLNIVEALSEDWGIERNGFCTVWADLAKGA